MKMTHKHDVYFSPHSTEAHSLVMQIADYCNKRGIWYKISESTLGIGIVYGGNVGYVIDADRKTEPSSSEIPNNCEDFFREPTAEERKAVADYIDSISVPTGVNVFDLMDEPQKSCSTCGYSPQTPSCDTCEGYSNWWSLEDEPQTERSE